ncbi:helix-turn-helix domain-containing protein [Methylobacterium sp. Leaf94]|uniref:helix-turn-helix domain-containing protein n=1 Tax=Methylobacterium sp. Leaf94 TaxID=1736250 RepID=UPI0009E71274|nr:helix-turn-helix domain-containing protein [Methylobacterium sp. Leaf94]
MPLPYRAHQDEAGLSEPIVSKVNDPALAYRVPEAARMIGISASTMWAMIARAEIPAKKIGGSTVVLRRDLEALVEAAPSARPRP